VKAKWMRGLAALMLLCMLSGCSMPEVVFNPEDLYSLPELPGKYTELNQQINEILAADAEYAAPAAGTNIQPVQMVDLNGDGRQEAVAFFRKPSDEKPLKIYIFTIDDERCRQSDLIEASGTGIFSIAYEDMDGDGLVELIVGWKATADLQVLELYSRTSGTAQALIRTNYVKYVTADLDGDLRKELVVLRADEESIGSADYYSWQEDGSFAAQTPANLSMTMAELSRQGRVSVGTLQEDIPALFVTGVTNESVAITDVLTLSDGQLKNITLSERTGVSNETAPFCALYPEDIDGDGRTEVPRPDPKEERTAAVRTVEWYRCDTAGATELALRTCHNIADNWYFHLPEEWAGNIRIARTADGDTAGVTFYIADSGLPLLRITAYTGTGREVQAVRGGQFLLSRRTETLYAAELLEGNDTWEYGIDEDRIREAFFLITEEWTTGLH